MKIEDVMTKQVESVNANVPLQQAAQEMQRLDVGVLPVVENGTAIGVVTDRDIVIRGVALGLTPESGTVANVMTKELTCCSRDDDVESAVHVMEERQIRRLPVVDADRKLVGIVTIGDIAARTGERSLAGEAMEKVCQPA